MQGNSSIIYQIMVIFALVVYVIHLAFCEELYHIIFNCFFDCWVCYFTRHKLCLEWSSLLKRYTFVLYEGLAVWILYSAIM